MLTKLVQQNNQLLISQLNAGVYPTNYTFGSWASNETNCWVCYRFSCVYQNIFMSVERNKISLRILMSTIQLLWKIPKESFNKFLRYTLRNLNTFWNSYEEFFKISWRTVLRILKEIFLRNKWDNYNNTYVHHSSIIKWSRYVLRNL